jgi:RNA polymerase sigma-70 factor (ECF subfamily)
MLQPVGIGKGWHMREGQQGEPTSHAAFDAIVAEYDRKVFNVAYRILGDYDEAADVTQETFISAYKSYHRFRGDSAVYTWLYQIAMNNCRNRLRSRQRTQDHSGGSLDAGWADEATGEATTREIADLTHAPHKLLEQQEMREKLMEAVQSLPQEYREVVILREVSGLSYNEIADAAGISLDNVKTRLSRARAMLRRKLEWYYSAD